VHSSKTGMLQGIRFSPDGTRLVAADAPGGVAHVWDVATGAVITTVNTDCEYEPFTLTADWSRLTVARTRRSIEKIELDGQKALDFKWDGELCVWDLPNGDAHVKHQSSPSTGFYLLSSDLAGRKHLYMEYLPTRGTVCQHRVGIWDSQLAEYQLLGDYWGPAAFSPDGRQVAVCTQDASGVTESIRLFDTESFAKVREIPVVNDAGWFTSAGAFAVLPEQNLLIGEVTLFPKPDDYAEWNQGLRFWNLETGEVLGTIVPGGNQVKWAAKMAPDLQSVAMTAVNGEVPQLLMIDVEQRAITHRVSLNGGIKAVGREPAFTPDGRWIAAITQVIPADANTRLADASELPQPRIHLVEVATGEIREVIIAPQGVAAGAAFSPNGKLLATTEKGRVLLWDVTDLPSKR
jgi:WD40 repeat protein